MIYRGGVTMRSYYITFLYSHDTRVWSSSSARVNATSDEGAILQVKSMYPYVKEIRIQSIQ